MALFWPCFWHTPKTPQNTLFGHLQKVPRFCPSRPSGGVPGRKVGRPYIRLIVAHTPCGDPLFQKHDFSWKKWPEKKVESGRVHVKKNFPVLRLPSYKSFFLNLKILKIFKNTPLRLRLTFKNTKIHEKRLQTKVGPGRVHAKKNFSVVCMPSYKNFFSKLKIWKIF